MTFKKTSYRDTWAEINLENIKYNVDEVTKLFNQPMNVMAVVKADGYGHGAVESAEAAIEAGARFLGTALLEEALELREAGIETPILVLGRINPEDAGTAQQHGIRITVFQNEWLQAAETYLSKDQPPLLMHIKVDTGMGRIGMKDEEEILSFIHVLDGTASIQAEGVFTHFATADELDTTYWEAQYRRFLQVLGLLNAGIGPLPYVHCGNSATALRFPDHCFNMVRFGISMYGLTPSQEIMEELPFPLKEAFSLHSRIVHVKQTAPGESISYGAAYTTSTEEWIATVPIGYADGWYRYHSSEGGEVLVNGERVPIVGRICMDQMMIRLPAWMPVGTKVTLIGSQHSEHISVLEAARRIGTITYEIPCMISSRVPRCYTG
ncbi:alanine racemase [Salibacterium qingdaonense]|uniref:Alanine racemase n=1 Tax=Salibacterium qingdaonense TaxID=266892 RepID=A0A1I4I824_9BACI|nr:alanine racemase [Salibacterium qingdaonense]SFL50445.1 alanine racemase [Salibacterium qingdaonense]